MKRISFFIVALLILVCNAFPQWESVDLENYYCEVKKTKDTVLSPALPWVKVYEKDVKTGKFLIKKYEFVDYIRGVLLKELGPTYNGVEGTDKFDKYLNAYKALAYAATTQLKNRMNKYSKANLNYDITNSINDQTFQEYTPPASGQKTQLVPDLESRK